MPILRPTPRPTFKALAVLAAAAAMLADIDGWDGQLGLGLAALEEFVVLEEELEFELVVGNCCSLALGTSVIPGAKSEPFCMRSPDFGVRRLGGSSLRCLPQSSTSCHYCNDKVCLCHSYFR